MGFRMWTDEETGAQEVDQEKFRGADLSIRCIGYADRSPEPGRMRGIGRFAGLGRSEMRLIHGDREVNIGISSNDFSAWATYHERNFYVRRAESVPGSLLDAIDVIRAAFAWATGNPDATLNVIAMPRMEIEPGITKGFVSHDE